VIHPMPVKDKSVFVRTAICRNTSRRTSLADRNSFRSPCGKRDSGNVQLCPLGSTFVRTAESGTRLVPSG
jgi:hypothetical protein